MCNKIKINLLGLCTVLLWSISFPFSKIAMEHFSAYSLSFLRITIATITLIILGKSKGFNLPRKKDLVYFFLGGACGFALYLFTFNRGIQTITSAASSIIISLCPIFTAIFSHYIYNEKINKLGWFLLLTAFIGVLIMMLWDGVFSVNIGMFWTFAAAILFSLYNILNRKLIKCKYKAIEIVTYSFFSSMIILSPFLFKGINEVRTASIYHLCVLFMLGILSSAIAYYLWAIALSLTTNTSEVTNYAFLTPFFATCFGSFILKEIPNFGTILGGLVIIVSIVLFSIKGKKSS